MGQEEHVRIVGHHLGGTTWNTRGTKSRIAHSENNFSQVTSLSLSRFFSRYLSFPNAEVQNQEESAAVCLLLCGNTLWFGTLVALWGKVHLTRSGSKGLGPLTVKFSNHSLSLSPHSRQQSVETDDRHVKKISKSRVLPTCRTHFGILTY